jgi:hypothetical protein
MTFLEKAHEKCRFDSQGMVQTTAVWEESALKRDGSQGLDSNLSSERMPKRLEVVHEKQGQTIMSAIQSVNCPRSG